MESPLKSFHLNTENKTNWSKRFKGLYRRLPSSPISEPADQKLFKFHNLKELKNFRSKSGQTSVPQSEFYHRVDSTT